MFYHLLAWRSMYWSLTATNHKQIKSRSKCKWRFTHPSCTHHNDNKFAQLKSWMNCGHHNGSSWKWVFGGNVCAIMFHTETWLSELVIGYKWNLFRHQYCIIVHWIIEYPRKQNSYTWGTNKWQYDFSPATNVVSAAIETAAPTFLKAISTRDFQPKFKWTVYESSGWINEWEDKTFHVLVWQFKEKNIIQFRIWNVKATSRWM